MLKNFIQASHHHLISKNYNLNEIKKYKEWKKNRFEFVKSVPLYYLKINFIFIN
jgi:hypothetical protein